jgi:hypothetical protein
VSDGSGLSRNQSSQKIVYSVVADEKVESWLCERFECCFVVDLSAHLK